MDQPRAAPDLMILPARTTPLAEMKTKSEGMSIFIVDLHQAIGHGLEERAIPNLVDHETHFKRHRGAP